MDANRRHLSSSYNFHRALLINKLASFLNEQGIQSYLMRLPVCKMDFTPQVYSQDELWRLFEAADHFRIKKGLRQIMFMPALLRLMYCTGLRGGEALPLSVGDVNLDDQTILVRDSKNGQQRVIPFSDSLVAVLRQYAFYRNELPACLVKKDRFFISLDGKSISRDCFGRWFHVCYWLPEFQKVVV
jgi:integrase/recombinase XerD